MQGDKGISTGFNPGISTEFQTCFQLNMKATLKRLQNFKSSLKNRYLKLEEEEGKEELISH